MKTEYRIKEVIELNTPKHFVVEKRYVNVKFLLSKKTKTAWRTVMLPDYDMEANECERPNYNTTLEDAKKLIETLKEIESTTKYHYDE